MTIKKLVLNVPNFSLMYIYGSTCNNTLLDIANPLSFPVRCAHVYVIGSRRHKISSPMLAFIVSRVTQKVQS
jgi:hypothetical protein